MTFLEARPSRVGTHTVEMQPPDVLVLRVVGTLTAADVHGIFDLFEQFAKGPHPAYILADLEHIGPVPPDARNVVGMRQLPPAYGGLALFNGTFQQQLVAKLATTAGWLLRGRKLGKPRPVALRTEDDAWAWVADKRGHKPRARNASPS